MPRGGAAGQPQDLAAKGSLYVTRPLLDTHIASRADLVERASSLFEIVKSGKLKIETTARYKLADAQKAHRDLEDRKTTGSIILQP
jgi:NADPH2:quinone reductase